MRESLKLWASFSVAIALAACNAGSPSVPVTTERSDSQAHQEPSGRRCISRGALVPALRLARCSVRF